MRMNSTLTLRMLVFVNAGASEVLPSWLGSIRDGGRLLVPLTVDDLDGEESSMAAGWLLKVLNERNRYRALFISDVDIFNCLGARNSVAQQRLRTAFARGDIESVRSIRTDPHPSDHSCWCHFEHLCLSSLDADQVTI